MLNAMSTRIAGRQAIDFPSHPAIIGCMKTGILLHVYSVDDKHWKQIAWGNPALDALGCLPKLCQLLLSQALDPQIVIYSGPSTKDGLSEGAYTKKFLLDNFDNLADFPTLRSLMQNPEKVAHLRSQLQGIILGENLIRTADEVAAAAKLFASPDINSVVQIACASHAPRCIKEQVIARSHSQIAPRQIWSVIAGDTLPTGVAAEDTVIFEKPRLSYDPMIDVRPSAPEVLRQYFALSPEVKRAFLVEADAFMKQHR